MKKFIIIADRIKSSGGVELLCQLIEELNKQNENIVFVDKRLYEEKKFKFYKNIHFFFNKSNIFNTFKFNNILDNCISRNTIIINFNGTPVFIFNNKKSYIFLQNANIWDLEFELSFFYFKHFLIYILLLFSISKNTEIIVQTKYMKNLIKKKLFQNNKFHILPFHNFLKKKKSNHYLNISKEKMQKTFLYFFSIENHKNYNFFFDVWSSFQKSYPEQKLLIVFFGELNKCIKILKKYQIRNFKIYSNISSEKLDEIYNLADVLLHSSLRESFSMTLFEAFTKGIDIILPNLPYINLMYKIESRYDPNNFNSLYDLLEKYINNKDEYSFKPQIKIKVNNANNFLNYLINE